MRSGWRRPAMHPGASILEVGHEMESIQITIDSGAAESVMPEESCKEWPTEKTHMTGQKYRSAAGGRITNKGQKSVKL